jgi:hypothetical protein
MAIVNIFQQGTLPSTQLQREIFTNSLPAPMIMWLKRANKDNLLYMITKERKIKTKMLGCKENQMKEEPVVSNRRALVVTRPQQKFGREERIDMA